MLVQELVTSERVRKSLSRYGSDAEDMLQDACVRAMTQPSLKEGAVACEEAFAVRLAQNVAKSHVRREKAAKRGGRHERQSLESQTYKANQLEMLADRDEAERLWAALSILTDELRKVLEMRYVDNQEIGAIASHFGWTYQTAVNTLRKAKRAAKKAYEPVAA
jgi:RNA polymerase sigma factor (sigma-70 family)